MPDFGAVHFFHFKVCSAGVYGDLSSILNNAALWHNYFSNQRLRGILRDGGADIAL